MLCKRLSLGIAGMTQETHVQRKEKFPRENSLPAQSPIFWVEQKDRYLRQLLIRDVQEITGRTLLVYFANRFEVGSEISHSDLSLIVEIFSDANSGPIDFLVETNGGSTDAADSIISYIKNKTKDLRVIVANCAKSNGTLIALSAKSILMGPTSELGPIEPSVNNIPCSILIQPTIAAQNFPLHMYGQYALKQTTALATKLLREGMMAGRDQSEIDSVVRDMSSRDTYPSHGSSIDHNEAKRLGLNVEILEESSELWRRIWLLHCMYDFDCRKSKYLKIFEGPAKSTAVAMSAPFPAKP
jgi:hypothetical protein